MEAFCALFHVTPIETIIIRDLSNRAGYNLGTVYQYFEGVSDFLTYLVASGRSAQCS